MAGNNSITVRGNLGRDPEIRFLPDGTAVCDFSVADTERVRQADGTWTDGTGGQKGDGTSWYKVVVWRRDAEVVADNFRKGDKVIVVGTQKITTWKNKEGETVTTVEITADRDGVGKVFKPAAPPVGGVSDPW